MYAYENETGECDILIFYVQIVYIIKKRKQKYEKKGENSYQKMKRSLDERRIQTHGNLIEIF